MPNDDAFFDDAPHVKSKTQIKNDMHALQKLGEALTRLTREQLDQLPLDETLLTAILETESIRQRIAKKRHLKFIGKLLRKQDTDALNNAYQALLEKQHRLTRQMHVIEKWRDDLINATDNALQRFISEFPECDKQQLRQTIQLAQKGRSHNKPPTHARKLFKLIRELFSQR